VHTTEPLQMIEFNSCYPTSSVTTLMARTKRAQLHLQVHTLRECTTVQILHCICWHKTWEFIRHNSGIVRYWDGWTNS